MIKYDVRCQSRSPFYLIKDLHLKERLVQSPDFAFSLAVSYAAGDLVQQPGYLLITGIETWQLTLVSLKMPAAANKGLREIPPVLCENFVRARFIRDLDCKAGGAEDRLQSKVL